MPHNEVNLVLDSAKIMGTIKALEKRIEDRFPSSSLLKTCKGFIQIADDSQENINYIGRPNLSIRIFALAIILMGLVGIIYSFTLVNFKFSNLSFVDVVTLAEATINDLVLLGAAIFFLVTLEVRLKRNKAIKILDQLRGLAHVIDMHQLTKDPVMIGVIKLKTYNSPERSLSKFELQRYLDYCSEMLSLIGKVAALYSQSLPDDVIVRTVNEIESLTSGFSRKVWQKIMILADIDGDAPLTVQMD
ncbi:hypothetical protein [Aureispira anguillae]|uniref:Uncharacterized protein n=1 Tax=Aureispira anguillae TaxID=2864201 RepID=A0A915YD01_9BACT|nr:hypothetical protein [Aureispira anguillae]BDS10803.1 hypothetical protein AsAng_0015120 [Aureispira anguillae]